MILQTANGKQYKIGWIGVASIDGVLRFALLNTLLADAFSVFTNKDETGVLVSVLDDVVQTYEGFTEFRSIDANPDGSITVALGKG